MHALDVIVLIVVLAPMAAVLLLTSKKPRLWYTPSELARWEREYDDSNHVGTK